MDTANLPKIACLSTDANRGPAGVTTAGAHSRSQAIVDSSPATLAGDRLASQIDDDRRSSQCRAAEDAADAAVAGWRWGRDWGPSWNSADVDVMEYVVQARLGNDRETEALRYQRP